jgi:hypothetical protein
MRSFSARCSVLLWCAAFLAVINLVGTGCGGPQWPRTQARADRSFLRGARPVYTIDVLPPDVQVWTSAGSSASAEDLAARLDGTMRDTVGTALLRRGYHVLAQLEWDGTYVAPDGAVRDAMATEHVGVTAYSLSGYGHAVEAADQGLLVPYLPHRLGSATGADATLYIGGWAYVGKDPNDNRGAKIAKGIVIGILVIAVVAILIIALDKAGGKGLGKAAGGVGQAASSAGRAAARVAVTAGRVAARSLEPALRTYARVGPRLARGMLDMADAFGHIDTHVYIYPGRPSYYEDERTPKKGRSRMLLEMTLVDNRSGMVLWHSRELFPAHATQGAQVRRAFASLLSTLPPQ